MTTTTNSLWDRYRAHLCAVPELLTLDISRVRFPDTLFDAMAPAIASAFDAMEAIEAGIPANISENRMVGHYWLRAPHLAPHTELRDDIERTVDEVVAFAEEVHFGSIRVGGEPIKHLAHIGIGGSALGPQLACEALRSSEDLLSVDFLDNSDPDGITVLAEKLGTELAQTAVSVVSKCGFTPTPRYVHLEVARLFAANSLDFARHAIATTTPGSDLADRAGREHWLAKFPMWDWVGGRVSVTSAVGLLPLALQGVDIRAFLHGAAAMDTATRSRDPHKNPAMLLALMWHWLGGGKGEKNMVVLPYRDRLQLLPRYIQQLVMESIGKRLDRDGQLVEQGLTVYGNKGSTDQHAYLQQLRAGKNDFFVLFVRVQKDRAQPTTEITPGITLGDYLFCSSEGSRDALYERGRDSITITLPELTPKTLGGLIALLERAVGFYAELININAYDQPGVDKFVADPTVALQQLVLHHLRSAGFPHSSTEIAVAIERPAQVETVYKLLERLSADPTRGIVCSPAELPFDNRYHIPTS